MRHALLLLLLLPATASAQDLVLDADVPADATPYFEVPFTVPAGTAEIEIHHDDMSDANILDWGLRDTDGFRGWGGGNTKPAIVGAEAASRSYLRGPISEGEWAVLIGQALIVDPPGHYHVEITFHDTPTLTPQTERAPYAASDALGSGPAWFAGDFHVHSRESGDASPTLDAIADFARSRGLDFVELSDHNVVSQLDYIDNAQSRHPDLLLLPGIEVTTYWGHANAIGVTEFVDFEVHGNGPTIDTIEQMVLSQGAAFSINHPVLDLGNQCLGCAWSLDEDPSTLSAIEVQNGRYSVTGALFYDRAIRFWEARLATGAHIAALGGSDDHSGGTRTDGFSSPIGGPTTMVYAEALTADAIVAAVQAGHTVVKLEGPDDPMVELTAGDAIVGDTVTARDVELRARVTGASAGTLVFLRNGHVEQRVTVDADPFETTLAISAPPGDVDDRWRAELQVGNRPSVLTSHIWIQATGEPIPPDAGTADAGGADAGSTDAATGGGCGCHVHSGRGASGTLLAVVALLFAIRRRRR